MKYLLLIFLLCLPSQFVFADDMTATIKLEAEKCAKALLVADYDGVATYTHKRVIKMMGGREEMVATLRRMFAKMHSDGFDFARATVGTPAEPKKVGAWITSMVPQNVVMKVPGGHMSKDSFLLGVSEDDGKTWVFLDLGPITPEQFAEVFPEFVGEISLPAKKKAVFQKDE